MKYVLMSLALLSMSCVNDDADDEDSRRGEIVGFWFPCELDASTTGNQACNHVEDYGMHYTDDDSVYRIAGAEVYATVKMGDTTAGLTFDIRVPELAFYGDREDRYGAYALVGDSLHIDAEIPGSGGQMTRISYRIILADGFLSLLDGDRITRRFRKYTGKATLFTKEQWEAALE